MQHKVILIDPFERAVKCIALDTAIDAAICQAIGADQCHVGMWFDVGQHQLIVDPSGMKKNPKDQAYFSIMGVDDAYFGGKALVVRQDRNGPTTPIFPMDLLEAVVRWEWAGSPRLKSKISA